VREAQPPRVLAERRRHLAIRKRPISLLGDPPPRAEVELVDRDRRIERAARPPVAHPRLIAPSVVEVPHHRGGARRRLGVKGQRVGLVHPIAAARLDVELVFGPLTNTRQEPLPDARRPARLQRVVGLVPVVPVADHLHAARVGRPHREGRAILPQMGAQMIVEAQLRPFVEEVQIVVREQRAHGFEYGSGRSEARPQSRRPAHLARLQTIV
jgi:hypothetical protein